LLVLSTLSRILKKLALRILISNGKEVLLLPLIASYMLLAK